MRIKNHFKIEEAASNDPTREIVNSVYVYQDGDKTYAVATNGRILAQAPVEIEKGELNKGNSIKAHDLKYQRSNPNLKNKDEIFCSLEPLPSEFPNLWKVAPTEKEIVKINLDIKLLNLLSRAMGSNVLTFEIISNEKPLRVSANNGASGLIMCNKLK